MTVKSYVAPQEPPQSRRPPATEVGIIGWLKRNLFGSISDSVSTIITVAILLYCIYGFLDWAVFNAQWEVAFLNLKNLSAGPDFPVQEAWRMNVAAYILVFLTMMAIGFWGRLPNWVFVALGIIAIAMIVIPILSEPVTEPPILYLVDADYQTDQVTFIADEGDKFQFTIDPLTDENDYVITDLEGYIANDNQLADTSWDLITGTSLQVSRETINPADYDLNLAVVVKDENGETIAQSDFSEGSTENLTFSWEAPAKGWYIFTAVENEENPGTVGRAWLRVNDLEVFFSTYNETKKRIEEYGEEPVVACNNCQTSTNRTDLRFEGSRTLGQYFSLELSPFLVFTRKFFFINLIAGLIGYAAGMFGKTQDRRLFSRILVGLWIISLPVIYFLIRGFSGNETLPFIDPNTWGGIWLTLLLTTIAIVIAFPIGLGLALGRQSELPAVSILCTIFIEVLRGVPLITLLFMGRFIVPFFHPSLEDMSFILRMVVVLTLFLSAYLAEVVRGGLQIVPKGQIEAARAVGLTNFQTTLYIVLPQALRAVIPAIMGQFVSLFKDTSLVALIGLFELTGAMRKILADTATGYSLFPREGYLFVGIIYFVFSYLMAEASRRLEETGAGAARRNQI